MFDGIARRYDLVNRVMSLGLDRWWRRALVRALAPRSGGRYLDLATGTGDVALALARRAGVRVVGLDPSAGMLGVARRKLGAGARAALDARPGSRVALARGDGQRLPFADAAFDGAAIAFGIRNVPDRLAALRELRRVVRPGGRVVVLELTTPDRGPLAPLARAHVRHVVPRLGAWLSSAPEYGYLERSIAAFPPAPAFRALMEEAGLPTRAVPLTFGAVHLFVGEREREAPGEA